MNERWARFVWARNELIPGPIQLDDERLQQRPIHIEFRRDGKGDLPLDSLRKLIPNWGQVQIDPDGYSHKEAMDLLMLGAQRACIDLWAKNEEIEMVHAVSEQILLRVRLPQDMLPFWLKDELFPRLSEVRNIGPRSVLLVGVKKGDVAYVFDRLPQQLLSGFSWWLAPDEGEKVHLMNNGRIAGWVIDGSRLLGVSR